MANNPQDEVPYSAQPVDQTQTTWERLLVPVAIALGLLLIVGGIALLGFANKKKKVAQNLPNYTPFTVQSTASPAPSSSPSPSTPLIVIASPTPSTQVANKGSVKGTTTTKVAVKATTQVLPNYQPVSLSTSQNLPNYTPNTVSSLPDYQPITSLPNYQAQSLPVANPTPSPAVKQTLTVTISAAGKNYQVEAMPGSTVLQAMQAAQNTGFSFTTKSYTGLGEMVTSINGQAADGSHYWTYTINGTFANKGISSQTVNQGDVITWTLN